MLTTITEQVLKPISGINDVGIKDYLTYIDPIGEYMEVKDIKNVSLFGKLYDVAKDQLKYYVVNADGSVSEYEAKPEKYDYTRQYYKIVPQDGDVQNNLSYKMEDTDGEINYSVTFNLSSIEMYVENKANYNSKIGNFDTYNEKLYINIPRNALPLEVAEIKIDENNKVISYSDNLKEYKESTPLRIYYTVGVEDSIIDEDGLIDLSKVSNEYIEKNTDTVNSKKYVSFYSNYFSNQKISNNSFGDATMSFSPSTSNQFFISNTPLILYEAQEEDQQKKEIILEDDSAYQEFISSHKTVNTVSTDNSNKNYYIIVEYYMPNKENIYHMAILRQGKEFGTGISGQDIKFGEYLCWYSPTGNVWKDFNSTKPDETYTDWVIATKPGGLIAGNMFDDITNKNANNTNTANTYLLPSISDSTTGFSKGNNAVINMYQGNNGKLLVFKNDLIIKKFVSGDLGDINAEWNIKVTLSVPSDQQLNTSYKIVKDDGTTDTLSLVKNEDNEYEGTIKIKDKETLTIKDLPDGTQYKLEEIEANLDNYQTTTKGDLEGTLSGNNPTVEFYNKKYSYHDLTIEKVVNDESNLNKKFNFQIKLIENPNAPLEEEIAYKGTNIDDGTIKFKKAEEGTYIGDITLANEQKITISLPYGTQYEVVEEDANKNGYIATYKNNKGVVNSEVEVTIVNEKDANNPFTVDNLFIYIIVFVASIILIVGLLFIKKKNNVK